MVIKQKSIKIIPKNLNEIKMKQNDKKPKIADDYFEIKFDENLNEKEFGNILRNNPYTEQDKIDKILSHLVTLDEVKKEQNLTERNLITKNIDFSISYAENGEKITENLSIPFGMGHFSKGIEHLREIGKIEYDKNQQIQKNKTLNFLKEKCKSLELPPTINISELEKKGWNTLDKTAEILNTISSPELSSFIQNFLNSKGKPTEKPSDITKKENEKSNQYSTDSDREKQIAEMKAKVKSVVNQKKSEVTKEKEISKNQTLEVVK